MPLPLPASPARKNSLALEFKQQSRQTKQLVLFSFLLDKVRKDFLERTKQARSARHGVHVYRWRRHVVRGQHGNVGQRAQGCDKAWSKLAFFFQTKISKG
jgi:hypothetical protein